MDIKDNFNCPQEIDEKSLFPSAPKPTIFYDKKIPKNDLPKLFNEFHGLMKDIPQYDYCAIDIHKPGLLGFFFKDVTDDYVKLVEIWDKKYLSSVRLLRDLI